MCLLCLALLTGMSCAQDETLIYGNSSIVPESKETRVNFSIVVPSPVQTRSITKSAPDEGAVDRVFLLLFENTGGSSIYRHRIPAENITTVSNTQKEFQANLPKGTYDIVVLANATEIIATAGIALGNTIEQVFGALVETHTGKWSGTTIPMWGQLNGQSIVDGAGFTIPMIRMMAKIEISVTPKAAGTDKKNFKLTDIRLYNYSSRGALVPDLSTWPADNKATRPTEPSGGYATMAYPAREPLVFTDSLFYTYEAPQGNAGAGMATNTCLIIGGSYQGNTTSYYRVDFVDGGGNFLPLLRNHRYLISIIEVVGDGYSTPEMAFETARSNMQATVTEWNSSGMEEIVVDTQESLEVSKGEFVFPNKEQMMPTTANQLTIRTSVPGGWTIESISEPWLKASEMSHAATTEKTISLLVDNNAQGSKRTAYVCIRAGKLTYRVTVTQKMFAEIWITDMNAQPINELSFPRVGGQKSFTLYWTPTTATVTVRCTPIGRDSQGNTVAFDGYNLPSDGEILSNSIGYEVRDIIAKYCTSTDPNILEASRLDFTIDSGDEIVTHSRYLRQYNY